MLLTLLKGDVLTVTIEEVQLFLIPDNSKIVLHGTTLIGVLTVHPATPVEQDQHQSRWQVAGVVTTHPVHGMIFMKIM
jgi:hypothetical protein